MAFQDVGAGEKMGCAQDVQGQALGDAGDLAVGGGIGLVQLQAQALQGARRPGADPVHIAHDMIRVDEQDTAGGQALHLITPAGGVLMTAVDPGRTLRAWT